MNSPNGRKSCECMGADNIECNPLLGESPKLGIPHGVSRPRSSGKGVTVKVPKHTQMATMDYGRCYDSQGETWPVGTIITDNYLCRKATCTKISDMYYWVDQATCKLADQQKCWQQCDSPVIPGKCDKWCRHLLGNPMETSLGWPAGRPVEQPSTTGALLGASNSNQGAAKAPRSKGDGVKVIVPNSLNVQSMPGGYGYCYDNFGQSFIPGSIIEDPTMCRTSTCTYLRGTQNTYFWSNEATCQLENREKCWENCDYPTISGQCDNWCRHIYTLGAAGPSNGGSKAPRTKGDGVKVIVPKNTNVESLPGGYGACYDNYGQSYVPGTIIEDPTMCRTSTCTYLGGTQNTYVWSNEATCQLVNREECWENCDYPTISGQCDTWCQPIVYGSNSETAKLGSATPSQEETPRSSGDGITVTEPKETAAGGSAGYCEDAFGEYWIAGTVIQNDDMCRKSTCEFVAGSYYWVDSATCEVVNQDQCWANCDGENPPSECPTWCEHILLGESKEKSTDVSNDASNDALAQEFDSEYCHLNTFNGSEKIQVDSFIQFANLEGELQTCLCFGNDKLSCYGTGETRTVTKPKDLQPGVFAGCNLAQDVTMAAGDRFR